MVAGAFAGWRALRPNVTVVQLMRVVDSEVRACPQTHVQGDLRLAEFCGDRASGLRGTRSGQKDRRGLSESLTPLGFIVRR